MGCRSRRGDVYKDLKVHFIRRERAGAVNGLHLRVENNPPGARWPGPSESAPCLFLFLNCSVYGSAIVLPAQRAWIADVLLTIRPPQWPDGAEPVKQAAVGSASSMRSAGSGGQAPGTQGPPVI